MEHKRHKPEEIVAKLRQVDLARKIVGGDETPSHDDAFVLASTRSASVLCERHDSRE